MIACWTDSALVMVAGHLAATPGEERIAEIRPVAMELLC